MDRKTARASAMQLVYEWEMGGEGGEETRSGLLSVKCGESESDYMEALYSGVVEDVARIDGIIESYAKGRTLERISKTDLAILRIAVYEISSGKVAAGIAINEAVELANRYSTEKAGAFINGVLGSYARGLPAQA